ncbi:hypothetical protein G4V62_00845 [Bacillaceae bacterium SIJ1]|uniref:hypothetical protein n=1 Tax=Litoribacterium kuwaitense TaxID=1398745 RepID=UPI0013EA175B|nr:hypothetical protein [Litoribacterium kuwaitense]NGP43576.1 hypothetical protein [Litoribacterium kuwaitense]
MGLLKQDEGHSLIELMLVLSIVSSFAVMIAWQMPIAQAAKTDRFVQQFVTHLRELQLSSQQLNTVGIFELRDRSYTMKWTCCASERRTYDIPEGVDVEPISIAPTTYFGHGSPYKAGSYHITDRNRLIRVSISVGTGRVTYREI